MAVDEQLIHEARLRPRQAVVAGLAAVLLIAAAVVQLAGPHTKVDELTLDLITSHKRFPLDLIGSIINGLGLLAVAWTLSFLFAVTRVRHQGLQPFIQWLAVAGGGLAAVSGVAYAAVIAIKSNQFVTQGSQTYEQANHITNATGLVALPLIGQLAALLLAISFVLISLNAMRVGLLTRFMGYLGIFAGILVLFPIGSPVPVIQGFWLCALAYLLSGRWPTGVPPSWRSGRIEKWPSSAEMRAQRIKEASDRRGGKASEPEPKPEPVGAATPARTRSSTPKRKRKRRR